MRPRVDGKCLACGRPTTLESKYTPEELEEKIFGEEGYFKTCDNHKKPTLVGKEIVQAPAPRPYTVQGLAYHVGIPYRTFRQYYYPPFVEEHPWVEPFLPSITRAVEKIYQFANESLWEKGISRGVIFNLKSNWGHKEEFEFNVDDKAGERKKNIEDMTAEEVDNRLNELYLARMKKST